MATCFDRKTVIIRPIKDIFKVQQSAHSMASNLVLIFGTLKMFFIDLMLTYITILIYSCV